MSEELSIDYFMKQKNKDKKDLFFSRDDVDRVLLMSLRLGAVYPSEIALETLLDIELVNRILQQAITNDYMERVILDKYYPQPFIKCRVMDLWNKGIFGYDSFVRRSWFILTKQGIKYLLDKFQGKNTGFKFNSCWLEVYKFKLVEDEEKKQDKKILDKPKIIQNGK